MEQFHHKIVEPSEDFVADDGPDTSLPISNLSKIMKMHIEKQTKISKEAKDLVEECVNEFICFITSEASDKCKKEKRKTINAEDILTVMKHLGFDNYCFILQVYYFKYRRATESLQIEMKKQFDETKHFD